MGSSPIRVANGGYPFLGLFYRERTGQQSFLGVPQLVGRELRSWGYPIVSFKRELRCYQQFCKDMIGAKKRQAQMGSAYEPSRMRPDERSFATSLRYPPVASHIYIGVSRHVGT